MSYHHLGAEIDDPLEARIAAHILANRIGQNGNAGGDAALCDERIEADGFITLIPEVRSLAGQIRAHLPNETVEVTKTRHGQSVRIGKSWSLFITDGVPASPKQIAENWKHDRAAQGNR